MQDHYSSLSLFFVPGLPSTRGEDLQMKCLLELYGLKVNMAYRTRGYFVGITFVLIGCSFDMFSV
jgi:hypothetical protein